MPTITLPTVGEAAWGTKLNTAINAVNAQVDTNTTAIGNKLDASAAAELIRDTMGTALVAGANVTVTVNDAGDTITIASSGGSGATWGGITGTLSSQTDLNTALNGKAASSHTHNASDINAGTLAVARLGSGTAAAGKYVDGGTGAWTTLPAGGGGAATIGATAIIKPKVGNWFGPYENPGSANTAGTLNRLDLVPLWITQSIAIDRIAAMVTAAGTSGAVLRLGIFNSTAAGLPGTVRLDAGTVTAESTGMKSITVSTTLTAGLYYLGAVPQGAVSTSRAFGDNSLGLSRFGYDWDQGYFDTSAGNAMNFLYVTGVTGALADLSAASLNYVAKDVIKTGLRAA